MSENLPAITTLMSTSPGPGLGIGESTISTEESVLTIASFMMIYGKF